MKRFFLYTILILIMLFSVTGCGQKTVKLKTNSGETKELVITDKTVKYLDYSPTVLGREVGLGKKVVLFFYAPWDPYSVTADTKFDLQQSDIPDKAVVLKVDYAKEENLKQKYSVEHTSTFIQIDKDQNEINRWVVGDVETLNEKLK
ncbi:thioredoxin family protein [Candidatus Falkowbacteria bacterium]|jgi:thiol-disulfide isomerase/thioredoxin|nr:thioredoxin family protein [Candidatus Falkowbacteria bacterium]MBT7348446.1 thioredoxin family protein [Candidatus Falkowbacteria bacterium]